MKPTLPGTWRINLVFGALMLAVPALCVHVGFLLRDKGERAEQLATRQQRMVTPLPARPGTIYARSHNGYVSLAISRRVPSCFIDPSLISDSKILQAIDDLADALQADPAEIRKTVFDRRDSRFVWIRRQMSDEQAAAVRALRESAFGIQYEWRRHYPSGSLASQTVGFRRRDGRGGGRAGTGDGQAYRSGGRSAGGLRRLASTSDLARA